MTMVGMRWVAMMLLQPYRCHQLAWFVYGSIEREQLLNVTACADWWMRASGISTGQFESPGRCLEITDPLTEPRVSNDKGEQAPSPSDRHPNQSGSLT